jgi:hypothetical protein
MRKNDKVDKTTIWVGAVMFFVATSLMCTFLGEIFKSCERDRTMSAEYWEGYNTPNCVMVDDWYSKSNDYQKGCKEAHDLSESNRIGHSDN